MAKKRKSKRTRKPLINRKYYKEIDSEEVYSDDKRLGKVFAVKNKSNKTKFARIISESKRPFGWRKNFGFDLFNALHLERLFNAIRKIAKKLGWISEEVESDINAIKQGIRTQQELISNLKQANLDAQQKYQELLRLYREKESKEINSRIEEFKGTIKELKDKILKVQNGNVKEKELQDFLYNNPWLFGTEYLSAQPQKMVGAHSKFDFYLERFNKTNDIIEIKLISDPIINKDSSISARLIQAIDQLIEYLERAIASAHSVVISEEEGIKELRPRGILIIGKDDSENAKKKIHKWNYQMSHITILTYLDIILKAEALIKNIEKQDETTK